MRIPVFGASGPTGTYVVADALAMGHEVTAFVRDRFPRISRADVARFIVESLAWPTWVRKQVIIGD